MQVVTYATPELLAVMLAQRLKDDCARRGVDSHGKGLCGEEDFDEAPAEEHLHHLLYNGQQTCQHTIIITFGR